MPDAHGTHKDGDAYAYALWLKWVFWGQWLPAEPRPRRGATPAVRDGWAIWRPAEPAPRVECCTAR